MSVPSIIGVVWFILPAYVANSMAINVSGITFLKRFSTPIDFGRSWGGKRLLGDGKTWRGLIGGISFAVLCALLQSRLNPAGLYQMTPPLGFLLGFGALMGDMAESVLKRRMGFDRGAHLFLLDQLDYIFGAYILAWTVVPIASIGWEYLLLTCIITVPAHYLASFVAWKLKLKKNPW
ncbi:MAG: CDP-2,3-bis-(O-geranylgeranyl)-sn-glycerol synthase [Candidatus Altiarchaeota archaeon]